MATLLPKLTEEDLAKVEKLKGTDSSTQVDVSPELYFLAEFGKFYGWEGIVALETGVISVEKAVDLVVASKKVWYAYLYEESVAAFYATKDAKAFNKGMKTFVNKSKVVE